MKDLDIQDALEYTEHIINTVHDPLIILFEDLRVAIASRSFYKAFNVTAAETEGEYIYNLGNHQWDIPKLRHLLEDILPKDTSFDNFEIEHTFPEIGRRVMLLNACRIYLKTNRTKLIIVTLKDTTESKKMAELKEKVRELEAWLNKNPKA